MSFEKKTWVDRVSQYPTRRKIIDVDSGAESTVDVERAEGEISNPGTSLSAENFNDLEERIFNAIEECFQYASDGKQMIADAITSVGVEVTSEESFASLANLITTKLLYVPKSQELTSEFAYTSYKEVGSSLWTIPFDSITENDIISVAAGAFSCKVDIKRLTIAATVYMGCGSQGSCRVNLYTDGAVLHYNGGSAAQGAKSMSYVWENIPAGTAFNIKTSSYQPNGNTTFKSAVLSLAVELE